jgi:uncharacterized protein YcbX
MTVVGTVESLWRFPVKSMRGEGLAEAQVTERGVLGDRAYALIDLDTGRVVSAKGVKLFPNILDCDAKFVEPPQPGSDTPPVQISLPDGSVLRSDSAGIDRELSIYFKRNVALKRSAPEDFTVDQYHPDIEGPIRLEIEMLWSSKSSGRHCLLHLEWNLRSRPALFWMCFRYRS